MKRTLSISALLLCITTNALAISDFDRCLKEEKELKAQEASQCSGLKYLLNPSACFATQKLVKEFAAGQCKKIGLEDKADMSTKMDIPKRNAISVIQKKVETETPQQETTIDQLKEENLRLKVEIGQLKTENERLRSAIK